MSSITIRSIVLACVFGGALFGMFLHAVLLRHHLSATQKILRLCMGPVGLTPTLVLALLPDWVTTMLQRWNWRNCPPKSVCPTTALRCTALAYAHNSTPPCANSQTVEKFCQLFGELFRCELWDNLAPTSCATTTAM